MTSLDRPKLHDLPEPRRRLLETMKRLGPSPMATLAARLSVSRQAVRQQLLAAQRDGLVEEAVAPTQRAGAGRPARSYQLTRAGEELFPKRYDQLAVLMLDTVAETRGTEALTELLSVITRRRTAGLAAQVRGKSLPERLRVLAAVYEQDDPFMEIESCDDGTYILRERNCPYLEVALARPMLCSSTVSVLTQLLGCRVVRQERFQSGHGCCSFKILPNEPAPALCDGFAAEPEAG